MKREFEGRNRATGSGELPVLDRQAQLYAPYCGGGGGMEGNAGIFISL